MHSLGQVQPQLLVVAVTSRHPAVFTWAVERLTCEFGPVALAGPPLPFTHTDYYTPDMGPHLRKQLLAFKRLAEPDRLAAIKRRTIDLEWELAAARHFPEPRPVNLDPGFLGLGKFVLATTKDQAHRVYLRDGIFAEVTLRWTAGRWELQPWTYPDYQWAEVLEFLEACREVYRVCRRQSSGGE